MLDDTRDKRDERDSRDKCQRIVLRGETIFSRVFGLHLFFNACVVNQELASLPATTLFASSTINKSNIPKRSRGTERNLAWSQLSLMELGRHKVGL